MGRRNFNLVFLQKVKISIQNLSSPTFIELAS